MDPKILTSEVIDAIFVDCRPGEKRERRRPRNVMNADGSFKRGSIAGVLLGFAVVNSAQAAADAVVGAPGTNSCKQLINHLKFVYRGTAGTCTVDCNALHRGIPMAEACAEEIGVAIQDGGLPPTAASKAWQSIGDNYAKLVDECLEQQCKGKGKTP